MGAARRFFHSNKFHLELSRAPILFISRDTTIDMALRFYDDQETSHKELPLRFAKAKTITPHQSSPAIKEFHMKNRALLQHGFTLIELVIVIAILGILSALALPKFLDLSSKARIASVNAARGALNSTAAMAKANYLVTSPAPATVTVEGTILTYTTAPALGSGYPTTTNLAAAAGLNATDYTITAIAASLTVSPVSAPTPATCSVVYTPPATPTTAPTIVTTTTGC